MLHTETDTSADTHTRTASYLYTFIFTRNSLGRVIFMFIYVCVSVQSVWGVCGMCVVDMCMCPVWLCMLERVLNVCLAGAGV